MKLCMRQNEKTTVETPKAKSSYEAQMALKQHYEAEILKTETRDVPEYFTFYSIFRD